MRSVERPRTGFTLVELLLVVVLIAVVTAMTVPRFKRTAEEFRLKAAAFDIYKLIQFAKENALVQQRDHRVHFVFSDGTYQLLRVSDDGTFRPFQGRFGKRKNLPEGISFRSDADKLACYPDGRCDIFSLTLRNSTTGRYEISVENLGSVVRVREAAA